MILYGSPGVGKSTFAANIPDALFLDIEGGTNNLSVNRIGREKLETLDDINAALNAVLTQEHDFSALVIDTADFMERVLMVQAAREHAVSEYAKIGYGKGPVTVANIWRSILQQLDTIREKRNMAIVLIAHETLKRINEPDTDVYDKFTLAMENKSIEILESWAGLRALRQGGGLYPEGQDAAGTRQRRRPDAVYPRLPALPRQKPLQPPRCDPPVMGSVLGGVCQGHG